MANISSFDLNLLRVLDALFREGTTVAAGRRLGLSQPAVSAALGRLRAALGDELFFRHGQRLEPTDFAREFEPRLRAVMAELEALLAGDPTFDPATSTARFRLSGSDFFAEMLMPQLAERLEARAPGMRVHLVDLVPDSYIDTLERYEVDLALIPALDLPDWVESAPVFTSRFVAIARCGHPRLRRAGLAPGDTIPIDLYCDLGHVLFSPEGNSATLGDAALARVGRERRVAMTLPVFSGVYRAVAGSDLIALLPHQLAEKIAAPAGVEIYAPPMHIVPVELRMVWHRRYSARPAHQWLRAQITEALAPLREG